MDARYPFHRLLAVQRLESRLVLAAEPIISEFLAHNQSALTDQDGDSSDWIEVRNLGDEPIDLAGWHLTDDQTEPAKWTFPATSLPAGGHVIVFASGKDRVGQGPSGEHHTNFRLDRSGEYLALVEPDGQTIASAFSPQFPIQFEDVSYGVTASRESTGYFRQLTPGNLNPAATVANPERELVITEIMYHPSSHAAEDEYLEVFNAGLEPVQLDSWTIRGGVDFVFPELTIQPEQYLVVAADVEQFSANYPDIADVVGGWTGRLSNTRERIELVDEVGQLADSVSYADEGDWSFRERGPLDRGARGWTWSGLHDGGGRSLELVTTSLPNDSGQNWQASTADMGTPGAENSVAAIDGAPLILEAMHSPIIPTATETVTVTARIVDELTTGLSVRLWWRIDGEAVFSEVSMQDDGLSGDARTGDGIYAARIPAQPDSTVVEFYIDAVDVGDLARQWPAPTAGEGQVTNLLYQVDDSFDSNTEWVPGSPIEYRQIMTAAERAEFRAMNRFSDAQMNATLIAVTGTGVDVRYNVGVRYRGSGSRDGQPPNNRINIPHDRPWRGRTEMNINWNRVHNQIAGSVLFRLAGLPAAEANAVRMLSNGRDLYNGRLYVQVESLGGEFVANHFPTDSNGNLYKGRRPDESPPGGRGAGLVYHGEEPGPYVSYTKLTNSAEADYSDVIDLTSRLNLTSDEEYVAAVSAAVDVDQWLRFLAFNALIDNYEGGLVNGDRLGDDYALYRGLDEQRFRLIPHDLDSLFRDVRRTFYPARGNPALNRFLAQPEFLQKYNDQLRDLIHNVLRTELTVTALDEALRHVVDSNRIESMHSFMRARSDFVLSQLPPVTPEITISTDLPVVGEFPKTTEATLRLNGTAPPLTGSVLVNGRPAEAVRTDGSWSSVPQTLRPGINRIFVQAFDGPSDSGAEVVRKSIDVWYDDGNMQEVSGALVGSTVTWTAAEGPYHVTGDLTVAEGTTLVIEPGTSIYFDAGTSLNVRGVLSAQGTKHERIRFTSLPGSEFVPNRPSEQANLPDGPPRWNGVQFENSVSDENIIAYADIEYAQNTRGSIGLRASSVVVDAVSFRGTNLRMFNANNSSYVIRNSFFPDMFAADEEPLQLGLDNVSEHVKSLGTPVNGGPMIIQGNSFGTNKGHNDVIDVVGGIRPGPVVQILDNTFSGAGDELVDLGGDAYVAGNLFVNVFKGEQNRDAGYASAISTGDAAGMGTVVVARNVFWNVDHAINLKLRDATIFENNTVVRVHDDFLDVLGRPNEGSAINLFVDEPGAVPGAGAYAADNIFWDLPRVFGGIDAPSGTTSSLELDNNLIDSALAGSAVGTRSETHFDLGTANRYSGPGFRDAASGDFALRPDSPAKGAGRFGQDLGGLVRSGIWVTGEPTEVTGRQSASLTVGGPGIFSFRYRVNDGPWSANQLIGNAFVSGQPTIRSAQIILEDLAEGTYTVEVLGQDFAGNWQEEPTTSKTWTVNSRPRLILSEVLAKNFATLDHSGTYPDLIELANTGGSSVELWGYSISDDPANPRKFVFPAGTEVPPGGYLVLYADEATNQPGIHLGFSLRGEGEGVYIFDAAGAAVDSIEFGPQLRDLSIGRVGPDEAWALTTPTFGSANSAHPLGDASSLQINEWLASSRWLASSDFLELHNPDSQPVNLSGLFLSDEPTGNAQQHRIAPLSFIAADGYLALQADGNVAAGADHLNFRLSSNQELLGLFDRNGELLDRVFYAAQSTDVSQGLRSDGASGYEFLRLPTPGAANSTTGHDSDVTIGELHYHPLETAGDSLTEFELEFVELSSQSSRPTDISRWRLHEAIDYAFPAGTTIAAGGTIVVVPFDPVADPAKAVAFRAKYEISSEVSLAGPYSGQLSNRQETVQLSRPFRGVLSTNEFQLVDSARYQDEFPWPAEADGNGRSLSRLDRTLGVLAQNWVATTPTPGNQGIALDGDVDGDGDTNSQDINALQAAVRVGAMDAVFDLDRSGTVESRDTSVLVKVALNTEFGDANLDGEVNFADFLSLATNFTSVDAGWEHGDFDGDGLVLFSDFLVLANNFGVVHT